MNEAEAENGAASGGKSKKKEGKNRKKHHKRVKIFKENPAASDSEESEVEGFENAPDRKIRK